MPADKKQRHLFRIDFGDNRLGDTLCGAKSKHKKTKMCPDCEAECAQQTKIENDAINEELSSGTLAHMELMLAWVLGGPVSNLTLDPKEIMTQYLNESTLWTKMDAPEPDAPSIHDGLHGPCGAWCEESVTAP